MSIVFPKPTLTVSVKYILSLQSKDHMVTLKFSHLPKWKRKGVSTEIRGFLKSQVLPTIFPTLK